MQEQWALLESQVAAANAAAEEARAAAGKAEADLSELSAAYNGLEAHAFVVEEQLKQLEQQQQQQQHQGTGAGTPATAAAAAGSIISAGDAERRAAAAAEAARVAAAAEAEAEMEELLACLGETLTRGPTLSGRLWHCGLVDANVNSGFSLQCCEECRC